MNKVYSHLATLHGLLFTLSVCALVVIGLCSGFQVLGSLGSTVLDFPYLIPIGGVAVVYLIVTSAIEWLVRLAKHAS